MTELKLRTLPEARYLKKIIFPNWDISFVVVVLLLLFCCCCFVLFYCLADKPPQGTEYAEKLVVLYQN